MNFLGFNALADARGDGLHPQLRALLEARTQIESDPKVVPLTGVPMQAGPNPAPRNSAVVNDNVLRLQPQRRAGSGARTS